MQTYSRTRNRSDSSWLLLLVSLIGISLNAHKLCFTAAFPSRSLYNQRIRLNRIPLFAERKGRMRVGDLMKEVEKNPSKFMKMPAGPRKSKRTRKRVERPKQKYTYASQRKSLQANVGEGNDAASGEGSIRSDVMDQARIMGLVNPSTQQYDAPVGDAEPKIVGHVRVGGDEDQGTSSSTCFAYIIDKPAGWCIIGKANSLENNKKIEKFKKQLADPNKPRAVKKKERIVRVKVPDENNPERMDIIEYNELDILNVLTEKEIAQLKKSGELFTAENDDELMDSSKKNKESLHKFTSAASSGLLSSPKPSIVSWLKDLKSSEGTPIKGGNFWKAVAGATAVDDSGLVLLCPKKMVSMVCVDFCKYVAVVGNGKKMAPKQKKQGVTSKETVKIDLLAKLRKKRADDPVTTLSVTKLDGASTCSDVVQHCQAQLVDGIRGDPNADPMDRRAPRRLIHCDSMSVSSLHCDEMFEGESANFPDDILLLSDRRNKDVYSSKGSFLGRSQLLHNPKTNAYREINGAADGYPGWIVDRYDKWLLVQHDEKSPRGPLPSIHDGNTLGVYYLPTSRDRSVMGSAQLKPVLIEGRHPPASGDGDGEAALFPVVENGITYLVSMTGSGLSTGLFLDQRPQRAWLAQNCDSETSVLNCFAHCGAFSVAAATAGASTVSLDLENKWLDRIQPQMEANGIDFDEKHDCIYGDCFDWLKRLWKRGDSFDIVILDPPSTSVGIEKRRWSIKNDMHELVSLAAPLVKKGGLLMTTKNSASISPVKFARMCRRGLEEADLHGSKLERVVPMPRDFPSVGTQPVTNLVWRIM